MKLYEAIRLIEAIADEGQEACREDYDNGNVEKALEIIDKFLIDISEDTI